MQVIEPLNRVTIITGSFGSGKSEYSLNLSLDLAKQNSNNITLVDLDLVNAYFRSREARDILLANGVKAIVPAHEIMFSDLPISGPGIKDLIYKSNSKVVIDVGGDDTGATALSSYRQEISNTDYSMLMVVNPFRPFTSTIEQIQEMKAAIEYTSGLKITGFISNPNIGAGTTLKQVISKHTLVREAACHLNLPLVELVIFQDLYKENQDELNRLGLPVRPLNIFLSPKWLWKQQKEASVNSGKSNI